MPMALAEQALPVESHEPPRLPKHRYPAVVVAAAVLTIGAAAYSFTRAPALVDAGRNLRSGQRALARQDYVAAAAQLQRAHDEAPSSRKITISLAEADFGANRRREALELLRRMRLTRSEWTTLTTTMPPSIQRFFQPTS
jgi:thioredoxin-like negative regulator of GroEL